MQSSLPRPKTTRSGYVLARMEISGKQNNNAQKKQQRTKQSSSQQYRASQQPIIYGLTLYNFEFSKIIYSNSLTDSLLFAEHTKLIRLSKRIRREC